MINPNLLNQGDVAYYSGNPGIIMVIGTVRFFVLIRPDGTAESAESLNAKDASQLEKVCNQEVAAARYAGSLPILLDEI